MMSTYMFLLLQIFYSVHACSRQSISSIIGETCSELWITMDTNDLAYDMQKNLYGQHIARSVVLRSITRHVKNPDPKKALALSFHGWTGIGKTYTSQMTAKSLYVKGTGSKFVHFFTSSDYPHANKLETYKEELRSRIMEAGSGCTHNLFIFEEMDKMPAGLVNILKPFLDHFPHYQGVDYRKNIFIFLSNTGGSEINAKTYEKWEQGKPRDDITANEMHEILYEYVYNTEGGLWQSDLVSKNLIDSFVPFLPLERYHVKECIRDNLREKGYLQRLEDSEATVTKIADELHYFPKNTNLYSITGCKRVSHKVDLIVQDVKDEL